jgi:hypothetical protein
VSARRADFILDARDESRGKFRNSNFGLRIRDQMLDVRCEMQDAGEWGNVEFRIADWKAMSRRRRIDTPKSNVQGSTFGLFPVRDPASQVFAASGRAEIV